MKSIIFLLFFSLPICASAQVDCNKFKEGRFVYPDQKGVLSVRKGLTQKSYTNGKLMAIWKVEWIDECTYTLTCKKIKKAMPPFEKGDKIKCQILSTNDTCFKVRVLLTRDGNVMAPSSTGEMCLE